MHLSTYIYTQTQYTAVKYTHITPNIAGKGNSPFGKILAIGRFANRTDAAVDILRNILLLLLLLGPPAKEQFFDEHCAQ